MAELVDAHDSKSCAARHGGSIPSTGTSLRSRSGAKAARRSPQGEDGLEPMKYVYLRKSLAFPDQSHVGLTDDLQARLSAHNKGRSPHTNKYKASRYIRRLLR